MQVNRLKIGRNYIIKLQKLKQVYFIIKLGGPSSNRVDKLSDLTENNLKL